jgi:hypothetical protein
MNRVLLPALCSVLLLSCNQEQPAPTGIKSNPDGAKAASTALATADKIYTDATGDMKILVRTCDYPATAVAGPQCSYCSLDRGWVIIGGGAEIEGSPGKGRLRSSFPRTYGINPPVTSPDGRAKNCIGNVPDNDFNNAHMTWMGRSDGADPHRLRTYVVGLQINGVSEATLANAAACCNDNSSGVMAQPTVETTVSSNYTIISGGVDESGGENCFLTESRLNEGTNSWRGSASCSPSGNIKVYALAMDLCLAVPNWTHCIEKKTRSRVTGPVTGYGSASVTTPYPYITAGIGGKGVLNSSSSRFLADLIPLVGGNQGASVTTKDAGAPVNGTTTAYSVNLLGGRWGTWRYNSIRFASGTTLQRPAGAPPVTLMQSTTSPDAPDPSPYRWNLRDIGGGQYNIRNANPSQPATGECAYRQSGTSNVLVGPCGSSNEYRWTLVGHYQLNFQLRNVSSGTCLDNNNSTSNSALRLATCTSTYSNRQFFVVNAYNWPP